MVREIDRKDERPDMMSPTDRDKINEFSRLLTRRAEVDARLKSRENIVRLHDEAIDEMALLDETEIVPHSVGDVFLLDTSEQVTNIVEGTKEELIKEIEEANAELVAISKRLAALKEALYAKFGNTINLEES